MVLDSALRDRKATSWLRANTGADGIPASKSASSNNDGEPVIRELNVFQTRRALHGCQ